MKTSIAAFFLAVACLLFVKTSSAQGSSPQRDSQALDLLARCASAMGSPGPETTVSSSGTIIPFNSVDASEAVVLKSKGDASMRWEIQHANGLETIVLSQGHGKSTRGAISSRLPGWHVRYSRQEHFPALLCALEAHRPNMDIVYVGLEQVGGTSAHHIRISAAASGKSKVADTAERIISEFHIFLDARSLTVVKTMHYIFSPDAIENHSVLESYYNDYKPVANVSMPFTITHVLAGQKVQEIRFDKIELNTAIDDSDFSL